MPQEEGRAKETKRKRLKRKAILIDLSRCTGCQSCQIACRQWNDRFDYYYSVKGAEWRQRRAGVLRSRQEDDDPSKLSHNNWIAMFQKEFEYAGEVKWLNMPFMCLHCGDAACLEVCPVPGAITRDVKSGGAIVINPEKCIGCLFCVNACPFDVPQYDPKSKVVYKCDRCFERTGQGKLLPACVQACPTGAMLFGDRRQMIKEANTRLANLDKMGKVGMLYGERDVGGLGVMYILETKESRDYGLPASPDVPAAIAAWQGLWKPLTFIAGAAMLLFMIVHYAVIGPLGVKVVEEEEERELTEEQYERMIIAKRRAGKAMQDVSKTKYGGRRRHKPRRRPPRRK